MYCRILQKLHTMCPMCHGGTDARKDASTEKMGKAHTNICNCCGGQRESWQDSSAVGVLTAKDRCSISRTGVCSANYPRPHACSADTSLAKSSHQKHNSWVERAQWYCVCLVGMRPWSNWHHRHQEQKRTSYELPIYSGKGQTDNLDFINIFCSNKNRDKALARWFSG